MIIAHVGKPGSGKSYEAVKTILDHLSLGKHVYCNIDGMNKPVILEAIKNYCKISDFFLQSHLHFLSSEEIVHFWDFIEPGCLIVVDEAHKYFSNRDYKLAKNLEFAAWASTHRHDFHNVVLITQNIEKIDSHVRGLVDWTYLYRKVNFFGSLVTQSYLVFVHYGEDCKDIAFARHKRTYDSRIYRCYKSYSSNDLKEVGIGKTVNIFNHPIFYMLGISLVAALYFVSKAVFFTDHSKMFSPGEAVASVSGLTDQDGSEVDRLPKIGISPTSSSPVVERPSEFFAKLNYAAIYKGGSVHYRILYNGVSMSTESFPFPIRWIDREPYGVFPEAPSVRPAPPAPLGDASL
jgi:zona occludens toxin (predicted ATPase)